jgi:hypothetical protein
MPCQGSRGAGRGHLGAPWDGAFACDPQHSGTQPTPATVALLGHFLSQPQAGEQSPAPFSYP